MTYLNLVEDLRAKLPQNSELLSSIKGKILLYISDIRYEDLEDLACFDPKITFLFALDKCTEVIVSAGYYNLFIVRDEAELDAEFIDNAISSNFNDNKLNWVNTSLFEFYSKRKTAVDSILSLLYALKIADQKTFKNLIKYSLPDMIDSIEDLHRALENVKLEKELKSQFSDYDAKIQTLEASLVSYKELQDKYSNLDGENEALKQQLSVTTSKATELLKENKKLTDKLAEIGANSADTVDKETYDALLEEKRNTERNNSELQQELENTKAKLTVVQELPTSTHVFTGDQAEYIKKLETELAKVQSGDYFKFVANKLPIVTENVYIKAKNILYIKEMKSAIYMNSLIRWFFARINNQTQRESGLKTLLIVYDFMYDFVRTKQYAKNKFQINAPSKSGVVITNNFSYDFLRDILDIAEYDSIILIDRLGFDQKIWERNNMKFLYLIDSIADIESIGLKANDCVGFFKSTELAYTVVPDGTLGAIDKPASRSFGFAKSEWLPNLTKDLGIFV